MTALIILVFGIGSLFIPYRVLYIMAACWTVYHVFKQQHGIAKRCVNSQAGVLLVVMDQCECRDIYLYRCFSKNSLGVQQIEWVKMIAFVLTFGLILSTVLCQRYIKTGFGKCFLWSNTLLIVSSFYMYTQQYYFLAILIPRLVHDATAYVFMSLMIIINIIKAHKTPCLNMLSVVIYMYFQCCLCFLLRWPICCKRMVMKWLI